MRITVGLEGCHGREAIVRYAPDYPLIFGRKIGERKSLLLILLWCCSLRNEHEHKQNEHEYEKPRSGGRLPCRKLPAPYSDASRRDVEEQQKQPADGGSHRRAGVSRDDYGCRPCGDPRGGEGGSDGVGSSNLCYRDN